MKESCWPQKCGKFEKLPEEVKVVIVRIAVKEAIADMVSNNPCKFDASARGELDSLYDFKAEVCPYSFGNGSCSDKASDRWQNQGVPILYERMMEGRGPRGKLHAELGYKHRT